MLYINFFSSVTEPTVKSTISISTCFDMVRSGGENKSLIEEARYALLIDRNKDKYDGIKVKLPCVNYSFMFDGYRNGQNIIKPTGLIALDIDGNITLPDNDYNFASYRSLSTTGRLLLIKIENLTPSVYKYNYQLISEELGLTTDTNAAKATQPFVLPLDSSIYINDSSKTWIAQEPKKTHFITEKKERVIGNGLGSSDKRFSNIKDLISAVKFEGAIHDLHKKIYVASFLIPRNGIAEGFRNRCLLGLGYQFRALNPDNTSYYDVHNLIWDINRKHCKPPISKKEFLKIVESIMKTKREDLQLNYNESKRFLFNPDYDLTTKEKQSLVMIALNKEKVIKSFKDIETAVNNWDFIANGKITQKKITEITGKNIKTIKKYYPKFKSKIKQLNKEYSDNIRPPP